jgi:hypothetical protein
MPKFRIKRRDENNWVIERWQSGGIISRGRYAGQQKKEKWDEINPVGYFPSLAHAARRLLDEELAAEWPEEGWTGADLLEALKAAEARVLEAVKAVPAVAIYTEEGRKDL